MVFKQLCYSTSRSGSGAVVHIAMALAIWAFEEAGPQEQRQLLPGLYKRANTKMTKSKKYEMIVGHSPFPNFLSFLCN